MMNANAQEWDQVLAAAKREGKVVVSGVTGEEARKALTQEFEAKFPEIKLEYTGLTGREIAPRILAERRAGQKLWDVMITGANTINRVFKPAGALGDLRPALILPEVKGDRQWYGGLDFGFVDREKKYTYAFVSYVQIPVRVNRTTISSSELSSPKQLIDPKFAGKISMDEPRAPGSGAASLAVLMTAYGEDFVKRLLTDQRLVFTRDKRQQAEWLIRGRYPVAIGVAGNTLVEFRARGLGKDLEVMRTPVQLLNFGNGTLALMEGAPHPSSARVYINWVLSKAAQEPFARATLQNSRRTDVPVVDAESLPNPEILKQSLRNDEAWEETHEKAVQLAKSLIKQ
jgi:iron(III) transport system substrate-binding protein